MKRSEMVARLVLTLMHSKEFIRDDEVTADQAFDLADNLLRTVESHGMLPPVNEWDFHTDGDNADRKSLIYRTWEKE